MLRFTRTDWRILAFVAVFAFLLITACTLGLGATLAHADGNPVALNVAQSDPAYLRALPAGRSVTVTRQCGADGWFTETSAYSARGGALGGQRWTGGPFPYTWWPARGTTLRYGYVSWDGLTFTNHTHRTVLVAAWCS